MEKQRKQKRILAFGLMIFLVAVLSLSSLFIVSHAEHDCTGSDCEICCEIKDCIATVQHMAEALGTGAVCLLGIWSFQLCMALVCAKEVCLAETLVALKIRLDN